MGRTYLPDQSVPVKLSDPLALEKVAELLLRAADWRQARFVEAVVAAARRADHHGVDDRGGDRVLLA